MKKFNQYKLSKNDKQLIKNFNTSDNYRTLTKEECDEYWYNILQTNREKCLDKLYKKLRWMRSYETKINDSTYFIYDYYEKNFYNIFFYNISDIKEEKKLTNRKEDIELFKVICSIVLDEFKYMRTLSYKIHLPKNNTKLYFKLIDKIFRENKEYRFKMKKIKCEYYYFLHRKCQMHLKWNTARELKESPMFSRKIKFIDRINLIKELRNQYKLKN